MSNTIFKYNQKGLGKEIELGKTGGVITWDSVGGKFDFSRPGDAGNSVNIKPMASSVYGDGGVSAEILDNTLVTAGYVKGLVQGFRTKTAVQTVATEVIGAAAFDAAQGFSKDPVAVFAGSTTLTFRVLGLGTYFPGTDIANMTAATKQKLQDEIIIAGMRVLLKGQTDKKQNGIYEIKQANSPTNYYLVRTADMDVEDEAEGAYVYVQDGDLEGTGWIGSVVGIPASIIDPMAPVLGTKEVTFEQFHGKGTYSAKAGLEINGNEFSLAYQNLPEGADAGKNKVSFVALQLAENGPDNKPVYVKRKLTDMFEDFGVEAFRIHDNQPIGQGFSIAVAGGPDAGGQDIRFHVDDTAAGNPGSDILVATADMFSVSYKRNAVPASSKASSIELVAGDSSSTTATGGDIHLKAGDLGGSKGGNIVLEAGKSTTNGVGTTAGTVRVNASALQLPVGTDDQRPGLPADPLTAGDATLDARTGAVRMNSTKGAQSIGAGASVMEYFNGKEWISVEGASYLIHDQKQPNEAAWNTFISTVGTTRDANNNVVPSDVNVVDVVVDHYNTASFGRTKVDIKSHGELNLLAGVDGTVAKDVTIGTRGMGHDAIETPSEHKGTEKSGNVVIGTGAAVAATNADAKSGAISIASGNNKFNTGDVVIGTGAVTDKTGTAGGVGSVFINVGSAPADSAVPSINLGVGKVGEAVGANKINIGTVASTSDLTAKAKNISVGQDAGTAIEIGKPLQTAAADNTTSIKVFAQDITMSANTAANVGGKLVLSGREISVGDDKLTTAITIGNTGADTTGEGATVEIRGNDIRLTSDVSMEIVTTNPGTGVKFSVGEKVESGEIKEVGMISVNHEKYQDFCGKNDKNIPNVGYIKKVIGSGELGGSGMRILDVVRALDLKKQDGSDYNKAVDKAYQVGAVLPDGARITRVTVSVFEPYKWALNATANAQVLVGSTPGTGDVLMSKDELDISVAGATTTKPVDFISEYGSLRAGGKYISVVFDEPYGNATLGDITVLVEFVTATLVDH